MRRLTGTVRRSNDVFTPRRREKTALEPSIAKLSAIASRESRLPGSTAKVHPRWVRLIVLNSATTQSLEKSSLPEAGVDSLS